MVRYVVELTRALHQIEGVAVHALVRPATAPFFENLLGSAGRVHVVRDLPTTALSALEGSGIGIPGLRGGFDVVHGTKNFAPRWTSALRVLTVHDMFLLERPEDHSALKRQLISRPYLGSIRFADVILCVSAATRERMRGYAPEAPAKAAVVPLAVSSALLEAPPREVPALAGRRFALVVGDASPRKNLRLVVDGWKDVVADDPDAVLAVVGPPGWGIVDYGRAYDGLRVAGHLAALGHVDDGELRWCYENARVVLCPSLHEGFGLPAAEALAFGAPLITSEDLALCEVSGQAALHLPGTDAAAWVTAILAKLREPIDGRAVAPARTWHEVALETRDAVLAHAAAR
ncbi:MAG: glycosyltransferase family 4 protein [Actinomycetota bacterium]|nr:glycosyltransferase family 4 protein [Actinomycetota bacterium]